MSFYRHEFDRFYFCLKAVIRCWGNGVEICTIYCFFIKLVSILGLCPIFLELFVSRIIKFAHIGPGSFWRTYIWRAVFPILILMCRQNGVSFWPLSSSERPDHLLGLPDVHFHCLDLWFWKSLFTWEAKVKRAVLFSHRRASFEIIIHFKLKN